jgi:hypothetical protein
MTTLKALVVTSCLAFATLALAGGECEPLQVGEFEVTGVEICP